jgi:hypothetical protein
MNKSQQKREIRLMRVALGTEATILRHKGHLSGAVAIETLLATAGDDTMITLIKCIDEAIQKKNAAAEKRV